MTLNSAAEPTPPTVNEATIELLHVLRSSGQAPEGMQAAVSQWLSALLDLDDEGVNAMREGLAQGLGAMREEADADTLSHPALLAHVRHYEALDAVLALLEGDD